MYLSIDQSTSSTTVFLYNKNLKLLNKVTKFHKQIQKGSGYVEHDANEIFKNILFLVKKISKKIKYKSNLFLSITNQRETFVIFDTMTGKPLNNAIVWQCRSGQNVCDKINKSKLNRNLIKKNTGLTLDTYFPAPKLVQLLNLNKKLKEKLKNGSALFGTIDTYLIYRLTKQKSYTTDFTNASRTLFFDNKSLKWSKKLLKLFKLNLKILPEVKESSSIFGYTNINGILNKNIPISGVMGDSQASIFANQCFNKGNTKITLGTGASILTNIGQSFKNQNKIITTLSYVHNNNPSYSYECLINYAGATISWLKNNLKILNSARETNQILNKTKDSQGVVFVPAFVGLSSPHWIPDSKAMIYGLTPSINKNHIVIAALESIAFQIKDYLDDLEENNKINYNDIYIDGGIVSNTSFMQLLCNTLQKKIHVTNYQDMSSYGALMMGLLGMNIISNFKEMKKLKQKYLVFSPDKNKEMADSYKHWQYILKKFYL
ncbi:MAG: carbohydrate kinase [Euryarchaeota archaeon]|nr:carbohydrate kinase [Euryarchaeota archaeon]